MSIEITDYIDVEQRSTDLGLKAPGGACILPRHFDAAKKVSDLCHESSALDLKTLFREADFPSRYINRTGPKFRTYRRTTSHGSARCYSSAPLPHPESAPRRLRNQGRRGLRSNLFKGLPHPGG